MADCPECNGPLLIYELDGVETDHCIACGGTWLDSGELEMILENAGVDPAPLARALGEASPERAARRKCPRCRKKMHVIRLGAGEGVELDLCRTGHGIWLDRGEMTAAAATISGMAGDAVAAYFSELYPTERRDE